MKPWKLSLLVFSISLLPAIAVLQAKYNVLKTDRSTAAANRVVTDLQSRFVQLDLTWGSPVFLRIFKEPKELEVWIQSTEETFKLFRTYPICTFSGNLGPKLKEGDYQAPEGFYSVSPSAMNPRSRFHLSFNLGYPNRYDRAHKRTGSALMVHGNCVSIGCYAMGDDNIEEIYTLCANALDGGQDAFQVHCFPFHLTDQNLKEYRDHPWYSFWLNLKEGYDYFEFHSYPPSVSVKDRSYHFK
ncbi:MAG: murein L,D-transpeptidase family protein [Verrucomicrobiota bacterium]